MQHIKIFIPVGLSHLNPFAYLLLHTKTSRFYCGYKETQKGKGKKECNSQSFMTECGYQTSSRYIKEIIDKEGLEAFEIIFICHFSTGIEAHEFETEFLKYYDADINPSFINKHISGIHFRTRTDANLGSRRTLEQRQKMSKWQLGQSMSDTAKKNMSIAAKHRAPASKETNNKISNSLKGKKHSDTHKDNNSKAQLNRKTWNNGIINKRSKECPGEGWVLGRYIPVSQIKNEIIHSYKWWNNGIINNRAKECPGENYIPGRLKWAKI